MGVGAVVLRGITSDHKLTGTACACAAQLVKKRPVLCFLFFFVFGVWLSITGLNKAVSRKQGNRNQFNCNPFFHFFRHGFSFLEKGTQSTSDAG